MKKALGSITVLAASLILMGCGGGGDKNKDGKSPSPTTGPTPGKPAVTMTAEEFFQEFKKDAAGMGKKYAGTPVEITGTVKVLDWANESGQAHVTLDAGKGILDQVMCRVNDKTPWDQVSIGQEVKMRGTVPEFQVLATLDNAEIVEKGKGAAQRVKSQDLAAEFSKDPKATEEKYKGKGLIITGEVVAKEKRDITLKGDGKTKVIAAFDGFTGKLADPIKVGDTITIQVKYDPLTVHSDKMSFYIPLLMSK